VQTILRLGNRSIVRGIIVLFLQRSVGPVRDSMWPYLVASVACAVVNQIGNHAVEIDDVLWHVSRL
jgi:hypothetical protein